VVSKHIRDNYMRQAGEPKAAAVGESLSVERLTARQREVLQLLAEGHSVKQVAVMLGISVKTAETHRAQIMERLHIHDLAGLVRYAIRIGMIAPGE
jgi:DNA-binding NarL/FixJ family response regulator